VGRGQVLGMLFSEGTKVLVVGPQFVCYKRSNFTPPCSLASLSHHVIPPCHVCFCPVDICHDVTEPSGSSPKMELRGHPKLDFQPPNL
jgi:hypothetical protein